MDFMKAYEESLKDERRMRSWIPWVRRRARREFELGIALDRCQENTASDTRLEVAIDMAISELLESLPHE
jgi:hypothetical protein